jgi:hypothetical protein
MRVAALVSGWPRFCRDFDSQLEQLSRYNVDWYFLFWDSPPDQVSNYKVPPSWPWNDAHRAAQWIGRYLPLNHSIQLVALQSVKHRPPFLDQAPVPPFYAPLSSIKDQFWMLEGVFQLYLTYSKAKELLGQGLRPHDLVIRTRSDIGLTQLPDLELLYKQQQQRPSSIAVPVNDRRGTYHFNDTFCVCSLENMFMYAQAHQLFDQLALQGVGYNPEYLMGTALNAQGLEWPHEPAIISTVRSIGQHVPGKFIPEWGRWI